MTALEFAIRQFGSSRKLALALGRDVRAISNWKRPIDRGGCNGEIPRDMLRPILEAAKARGLDLTAEDLIFGRREEQAG